MVEETCMLLFFHRPIHGRLHPIINHLSHSLDSNVISEYCPLPPSEKKRNTVYTVIFSGNIGTPKLASVSKTVSFRNFNSRTTFPVPWTNAVTPGWQCLTLGLSMEDFATHLSSLRLRTEEDQHPPLTCQGCPGQKLSMPTQDVGRREENKAK